MSIVRVDSSAMFSSSLFESLDVGVGVYLVAFDYFVRGNLLPRLSIHLQVFDPVTGLLVELVEMDLFGIGCGWVQSDWASHEGKAQKAFPIGAGGHDVGTPKTQRGTADLTMKAR